MSPSLSAEWNTSVRATTPMHRPQFTIGTYTWPSVLEVCCTFRRGRNPSWTACLATENDPEIAACEAMIVAAVARITIGQRVQLGSIWKNGLKLAWFCTALG